MRVQCSLTKFKILRSIAIASAKIAQECRIIKVGPHGQINDDGHVKSNRSKNKSNGPIPEEFSLLANKPSYVAQL